ncbi:MAG TPA: 30S ribosomal protein S19 [Candidatus Nanoarchaeia archaeon]|nr:30S ribosomal protein S19 [Candidatus Nanoarchaeia archaeon]
MAKKEFIFRGKTLDAVMQLSLEEFAKLIPSRERRKIKRGFTEEERRFLAKLRKKKNNVETQCRDMVILPEMVGSIIKIYNGKEFTIVTIMPEMLGHRLGEFALTRRRVKHSAPGIGATRSSAAISVR